ncbi:hypothetical protein QCA50_010509 [Cerrena zonata]|uniref:C2H2-type domain-containing protein n=1 Tax=Cerrena zonata TaxID=2478898 RepID=A0AAW0G571_9APHY
MLDHLPSPVHTFPYHNTNPYPVLDPARPRHSFIVAPQEYPYANKPASRPEQSLSPLTDSDTDRPFAYNAPRDSDLDTRAFLHRPSSHSPNLSPPPLSASSSETHTHHPYSYDTRAYPDFEHSENALDSDRLPSLVSSGPPFTVSPLTSQPHTFAQSSSLDRRLSEPAIRSLYTTQPHHSLRPNQLPPLNHPSEQNVQAYSSSPPTHTVSYSHQRVSSDSSGSFSNPWPEKYPHPPPVSSDESDLANPAPIVLGSYDPHPDKHEESLSPSLDPASYPVMSDTELDLDEKLEKDADGKDKKTYSFVSLPGNAVKKRPRRRYDEIDRLYQCNFPNCSKAYGTLNHLNAHVTMQKHGQKRSPAEFKELRKQWRQQKKEADEAERQREREQRHMNAYALQHNTSSHHLSHPHINPSHHLSHPHAHLTHPSQLSRIAGMQQQPSGYPFGQRMFPRGIAGSMPGMPGVNTSPVRLYAPSPYSQQGQPQSPPDSLSSPTFIGDVYAQQQQQEGFDAYHSQILRRSSMGDFGNVGEDGVGPMRQAPQARTRRLSLHPYAQGRGEFVESYWA